MSLHPQFIAEILLGTPVKLGLFGTGIVAFALIWVWCFNAVTRKLSGWSAIAARYPMTEVHLTGESYKRRSGDIGHTNYERGFRIQMAQEGLCVYPFFARRSPCLIPWSSIHTVFVSKWSLLLVIESEKSFQISLPAAALDRIRGQIPQERFKDAVSFFEAAGDALKAMKRPRWLWKQSK
jgi:hypothetical protein